jgi:thioredoxin-related protein
MTASSGMERREMVAWVIAGALALALIGRLTIRRDRAVSALDDPAVGQARSAVVNLRVRDLTNQRVALMPAGVPAILMINSRTCGYCKQSLMDIAELQGSDDVPMLRVVTLEGAEIGKSMLASLGVRGAFNAGPDGERDQVLLTFRIPGTPVFARTDSSGQVVETLPGYPGRETLARWLPIMRGR